MEKITELLWQRSEAAFPAMAAAFGSRLQAMATNILDNRNTAEEVVNDTYLAIWNAIPPTRPINLSAFVHKTCKNIALNRLRHESAKKRSGYEVSLDELAGCIGSESLWEQIESKALSHAINDFLAELTQENRVIFLRRYWFGDSVKDIAEAMRMKETAVSVRLSRLRDKLKNHLTKEGFYE